MKETLPDSAAIIGTERQSDAFAVSSRKIIAQSAEVQVKEFRLAGGEEVPWHHHTAVFDVFYCIEGGLIVERLEIRSGQRLDDLVLQVGDSAKVEPGTAHRPYNPGTSICRFVLIQGIGIYDFLPFRQGAGKG